MDFILFGLLLIPPAIGLIARFLFKADISWKEFLIQVIGGCLALSLIWCLGRYSAAADTEVLNGTVTGKHVERFSCPMNTGNPCENGYTCNSRMVCETTGSGKDRTTSCHEEHDTCYVYDWEQNWFADSTLDDFKIHRIDDQGAQEPQRYTSVAIGDPVVRTHGYMNWVKASSDSLYSQAEHGVERYQALLPTYQQRIYDYYKIDRVYPTNVKLANIRAWNDALARMQGPLGRSKQINVNLVVVSGAERDYAQALRRHWIGFKKNESVIVVGLTGGNIEWAESMSWSKNAIYDVDVRNMIEDRRGIAFASIDPNEFTGALGTIVKQDYVRRPMKEFEYLKGEIPPPAWMVWISLIFALIYGAGTSFYFNRVEI